MGIPNQEIQKSYCKYTRFRQHFSPQTDKSDLQLLKIMLSFQLL